MVNKLEHNSYIIHAAGIKGIPRDGINSVGDASRNLNIEIVNIDVE